MWECMQVGAGVLIECPSRWYLGVVKHRTSLTVVLTEAVCGHSLGDLGLFLDGTLSPSTELTPMPRDVEISLGAVDSAQEYPVKLLRKVRKRTHTPEGAETAEE